MSTKVITLSILFIFILSLLWVRWVVYDQGQPKIENGKVTHLSGTVTEEPASSSFNLYSFHLAKIKILTKEKVFYGDKVEVEGKVENQTLFLPKIKVVSQASGFDLFLYKLRMTFKERIDSLFPEPEAGLLNGVLLGIKTDLTSDLQSDLKTTGTIHVAVVSGFNITVVGGFFLAFAKILGRKKSVALSLLAITFYSLLTGLGGPTLRATLMAGLAYLGVVSGRVVFPIYSLLVVAFVLYFLNPEIILDVGFQLSFFATLGILIFSNRLKEWFKKIPHLIKEDLVVTLSAQALVVPLIFYYFGRISLVSPLANALTLWVIPFVTIAGFVLLMISFIYLPFASLLAIPILLGLKFFVVTNRFLASLPWASIGLTKNDLFLLIGYYLQILSIILFVKNKNEFKKV